MLRLRYTLIELVDRPQTGFNTSVAPIGATEAKVSKTAAITADAIGISARKVERARAVLSDPVETAAVHRGEKTIHQAAEAAKAKRIVPPTPAKRRVLSPEAQQANDKARAEGLRVIGLLHELEKHDPSGARKKVLRETIKILTRAFR